MTYRELVYMALDALKIHSDDSKFTEDHVIFLLTKYRAFTLKQKYSKIFEGINNRNYQGLKIECNDTNFDFFLDVSGGLLIKSKEKIPHFIKITLPEVLIETSDNIIENEAIVFTNEDRIRYTGYNRFLKNIIYCCTDKDGYLNVKCATKERITNIKYIRLYAVFANPLEVENVTTDILDEDFPTEDELIPSILELVLKDLTNGIYKPSDNTNDAQDALSDLAGFLRRNMKSQFQKQIDE